MKNLLLFCLAFAFLSVTGLKAASELIISENFQEWEATPDSDESSCSAGVSVEKQLTRTMEIVTSSGTQDIDVTLVKCAIAPECESRRIEDGGQTENLPDITKGWVMLQKLTDENNTIETYEESADTIGELIFGPIPQIDSIRFAHSATGGNRGVRIYISTDGENWERPTDLEFWDASDSQWGDVNSVTIDETDVYIKFTAGFKQSDGTSQFTRLHNIDVWGEPGELSNDGGGEIPSSIKKATDTETFISPSSVPGIFNINKKLQALQVFNVLGNKVNTEFSAYSKQINLTNEVSGIYIVKALTASGEIVVQKIITK